jgi:hypothetical protein
MTAIVAVGDGRAHRGRIHDLSMADLALCGRAA